MQNQSIDYQSAYSNFAKQTLGSNYNNAKRHNQIHSFIAQRFVVSTIKSKNFTFFNSPFSISVKYSCYFNNFNNAVLFLRISMHENHSL